MLKILFFTFLGPLLFLGCSLSINTVEEKNLLNQNTSFELNGTLHAYEYDELNIDVKKGMSLSIVVSSGKQDVILYKENSVILENDKKYEIKKDETLKIRVLLPRAFARKNLTQKYSLKVRIEQRPILN